MATAIQPLLVNLLIIIAGVLLVCCLELIRVKIVNYRLRNSLATYQLSKDTIKEAVKLAAIHVNETYIADLKAKDKFTDITKQNACTQIRTIVEMEVNPLMLKTQGTNIKNVDKWLNYLIEATLFDLGLA